MLEAQEVVVLLFKKQHSWGKSSRNTLTWLSSGSVFVCSPSAVFFLSLQIYQIAKRNLPSPCCSLLIFFLWKKLQKVSFDEPQSVFFPHFSSLKDIFFFTVYDNFLFALSAKGLLWCYSAITYLLWHLYVYSVRIELWKCVFHAQNLHVWQ